MTQRENRGLVNQRMEGWWRETLTGHWEMLKERERGGGGLRGENKLCWGGGWRHIRRY